MNKGIALTIVAVILLGMGLVLFNEYIAQPPMPLTAGTMPPAPAQSIIPPQNTQDNAEVLKPAPTTHNTPAPQGTSTSPLITAETPNASAPTAMPSAPAAMPSAPAAMPSAPTTTLASPPSIPAQASPVAAPTASAPEPKLNEKPHTETETEQTPEQTHTPDAATQTTQHSSESAAQEAPHTSTPAHTTPPPAQDVPTQQATPEQPKPDERPVLTAADTPQPAVTQKPSEAKPAPVEKSPSQETAPVTSANRIDKISILSVGGGVTVRFECSKLPRFGHMLLKSPDRVVLDLNGDWDIATPSIKENEFVYNIRTGRQKRGSRIVIDLRKAPRDVRYLKYGETDLDVRIR